MREYGAKGTFEHFKYELRFYQWRQLLANLKLVLATHPVTSYQCEFIYEFESYASTTAKDSRERQFTKTTTMTTYTTTLSLSLCLSTYSCQPDITYLLE